MTPPAPPRIAHWLLRRALGSLPGSDTILGDLFEELEARTRAGSPRAAAAWYRRAAFGIALRYLIRGGRQSVTAPPRATPMDSLLQDISYGLRSLRQARGFVAASLATLAIGIGASTAIFSLVNAVLLRPLPYADPDRLVIAREIMSNGNSVSVAWPNYLDWRARLTSFQDLACIRPVTFNLTGVDRPERVLGRQVTDNFLPVLGVQPVIGRGFSADDDRPGGEHAVLVSYRFWQSHLAGDPAVLGRRLTLNNGSHVVIGVLPAGFRFVRDDDVYEPIGVETGDANFLDRGNHVGLSAIGRLRPGVTEDAARAELQRLAAQLAKDYPATNSGSTSQLVGLLPRLVGDVRLTLVALFCAVGFLLLLACVNVANLLVARGAARRHELAVRAALGCGRFRLVRQLLVESTMLATAGGALGVGIGWSFLTALVALAPEGTPRLDEARLDGAAVLFALGVTAVAGLAIGLLPALHASGFGGQRLLVRSDRSGSAGSHRLRRGLIIVQVAVALVLLTGAGLMMRTMQRLTSVDLGFDSSHLLTVRFSLSGPRWTDERVATFEEQLIARAGVLPGVVDAGLTLSLPIEGSQWGSVFMVGDQPEPARALLPSAAFVPVSPGLFSTLRLPLKAGRHLTGADRVGTPWVVVVNEAFARHFWPDGSAIGKRVKQSWPEVPTPWREIVGVVGDVKLDGAASDTPMQVYMPAAQSIPHSAALVVRTSGDPALIRRPLEAAIHELDRDLPLYNVKTMDELRSASTAQQRVSMVVLAVFAAIALALAGIGLYGVIAQGVTERTREIGVRMALGAERRHVMRLFVGQGLRTALAGIAVGLAGAVGLSRFLAGLLFQVSPTDRPTFGSVVLTLLGVAVAACYLPARRATRVNPTAALRGET